MKFFLSSGKRYFYRKSKENTLVLSVSPSWRKGSAALTGAVVNVRSVLSVFEDVIPILNGCLAVVAFSKGMFAEFGAATKKFLKIPG